MCVCVCVCVCVFVCVLFFPPPYKKNKKKKKKSYYSLQQIASVSSQSYTKTLSVLAAQAAARPNLYILLSSKHEVYFRALKDKAKLIHETGSVPLNRFRLYLCGYGGNDKRERRLFGHTRAQRKSNGL